MYLKKLKQILKRQQYEVLQKYAGDDLNDLKLTSLQIRKQNQLVADIDMRHIGAFRLYQVIPQNILRQIIKFSYDEPIDRIDNQTVQISLNKADLYGIHNMPMKFQNIDQPTQTLAIRKDQMHAINHILKNLKAVN